MKTLGCSREDLQVVASPKGLVYGDIRLFQEQPQGMSVFDIQTNNGPSNIPEIKKMTQCQLLKKPQFVLVVEKEAVFRDLCKCFLHQAVVVTGKGYPDKNTLAFLSCLLESYPHIPVYGLIDSDPYGFQILANYKFGSANNPEYPGIKDIIYTGSKILDFIDTDNTLPLSLNDRKLGFSILKKDWIYNQGLEEWRNEIQLGLFVGIKAELNTAGNSKQIDYVLTMLDAFLSSQ